MCCRWFFLIFLALLLGLVGAVSAIEVKVDFGEGNVVPEWTQWLPGGWGDPEGITIDGVEFTIVGPWDNWRTRIRGDYGDDLTSDCVGFEAWQIRTEIGHGWVLDMAEIMVFKYFSIQVGKKYSFVAGCTHKTRFGIRLGNEVGRKLVRFVKVFGLKMALAGDFIDNYLDNLR
jgi:hypothetical protein